MQSLLPTELRPIGVERIKLPDGTPVNVPKTTLILPRWWGAPLTNSPADKPLVDVAGEPMFAELAVRQLFQQAEWEARWLETSGVSTAPPHLLADWRDAPLAEQVDTPIGSFAVQTRLRAMAAANGRAAYGGCWDVLAWQKGHMVFCELQRKSKGRLRPTQIAWMDAGLRCGLAIEQFLVVEWDLVS